MFALARLGKAHESNFETSRQIKLWLESIIYLPRWIYLFWDSQNSRMCAKSAPSIITKSCHSLQFIAISRRSVNSSMNLLFASYLHVIMKGFISLQNSAPDKNSPFWVVSEHLMLFITQIHAGAFANYVSQISDGAPWFAGALSGRLPHVLVKSAPGENYCML